MHTFVSFFLKMTHFTGIGKWDFMLILFKIDGKMYKEPTISKEVCTRKRHELHKSVGL